MDTMQIHSRLYDYTVDFINDFTEILAEFQKEVVYVLIKMYIIYMKKSSALSMKKRFIL